MALPTDFHGIRHWDNSKERAFEELCFQLREPDDPATELIKPGDPDGGYEWYVRHKNGVEWGYQAKYTFNTTSLLGLMEASLKTVVKKRPNCRRLIFIIPYDLPDAPGQGERKSAQQKFEDRRKNWKTRIAGAKRVRIELISGGKLLERLAAHPAHRGISWFFWHEDVFSPEWCAKRLAITVEAAGKRYSPELHVKLPVAFALEGLAGSETFWDRYYRRRLAVIAAGRRVSVRQHTGLGKTTELRNLTGALTEWAEQVQESYPPPQRLPSDSVLELSGKLRQAADAAYPEPPADPDPGAPDAGRNLRAALNQLSNAIYAFNELISSGAGQAAACGALLMTGEAGQGKTHLFCDAGQRVLDRNHPALVLLGQQLSGRHFWTEFAERVGLGPVGGEVLLDAMRAAAKAAGHPFVLLIDALNESGEPEAWREELPALLAELKDDPWISLGFSVRSTFLRVVLPAEELGGFARADHPGFEGRELEATEQFFDHYGLEHPRVPLLTPEFTNPLFLRLYCEGLEGLGVTAPAADEAHVSEVFARYLEWKASRIEQTLALDPHGQAVTRALDAFGEAVTEAGREQLPRQQTAALIDALAPGKTDWPKTLFGQLLSEGLLAADVAYDFDSGDYQPTIRFEFQRFADFRIAASLIEEHASAAALKRALTSGKPLRDTLLNAPTNWIEALSVLVPERFGVELLDAASWRLGDARRHSWKRAQMRSLITRRTDAVSDRAVELARKSARDSRGLNELFLDLLLTVAPVPNHPLNSEYLHRVLLTRAMPDRDASWGIATFYMWGEQGPLDRLIRWASRGPHPHPA